MVTLAGVSMMIGSASITGSVSLVGRVLLGFGLMVCAVMAVGGVGTGARVQPHLPTRFITGWTLVVGVLLTGFHVLLDRRLGIDESLYLLQSHLFEAARVAWPLPDELIPFFIETQMIEAAGGLLSQYPPGWPLLLFLFDGVGLQWWAGIIVSLASLIMTYKLATRLASPAVGSLAVVLLGTNPLFLTLGGSYMSHSATMFFLVLAAWWLVPSAQDGTRFGGREVLAGLALGSAVMIRPFSGVIVGGSIIIWVVLQAGFTREMLWRGLAVVGGGIVPVLFLLSYNYITNGAPLVFGYDVAHDGLSALGFGPRGFITYTADGAREIAIQDYSLLRALEELPRRMWEVITFVVPAGILLPLLALTRPWPSSGRVLLLLSLPLGYVFYFFSGPRFYLDVLPLWLIVLSVAISRSTFRPAAVRRALGVAVLMNAIAGGTALLGVWKERNNPVYPAQTILRMAEERGPLLVFIRGAAGYTILGTLWWLNIPGCDSPAIVVRDRGTLNHIARRAFPNRHPVLLDWRGLSVPPELIPLTVDPGADTDGGLCYDSRGSGLQATTLKQPSHG